MSVIAERFWRFSETAFLTLCQRRHSLCLRPCPHCPAGSQASQASSVGAPMTEIAAPADGYRPCTSIETAYACMTRGRTPLNSRGAAANAARSRGPAITLQRRAERWLKILYRRMIHTILRACNLWGTYSRSRCADGRIDEKGARH